MGAHRPGLFFLAGHGQEDLIADKLAPLRRTPLRPPRAPRALTGWAAALGYSLQLYFDFSGYSDMAVGLALLIGLRFPQNFDSPYKAVNTSDFWRRWHMTLSVWLRDYLFIPLGGSRGDDAPTVRNLVITFLRRSLARSRLDVRLLGPALQGCLPVGPQSWPRKRGLTPRSRVREPRSLTFARRARPGYLPLAGHARRAADVLGAMFGLNGVDDPPRPGYRPGSRSPACVAAAAPVREPAAQHVGDRPRPAAVRPRPRGRPRDRVLRSANPARSSTSSSERPHSGN